MRATDQLVSQVVVVGGGVLDEAAGEEAHLAVAARRVGGLLGEALLHGQRKGKFDAALFVALARAGE